MRILTGIQPSGTPHLGNYFGAMRQVCDLQQKGESFLFIADYHALTTNPEPAQLRERIINLTLDFLACGVDVDKTVFFRQSAVPEVCELMWLLNTVTPVGFLERAHSYKDKTAKGFMPNNGLFSYPVLMAADILLYQADLVPVGKDQKQHLEITRDLAIKFNNEYGDIFTIPEGYIQNEVAIVPGIDGQKMSKSYNNTIPIFGKEKALRKTVMSIVTDCKSLEEVKDPENCNVVALYKLFATPEELEEMKANYRAGNYGYGHAKQALFEKIWAHFEPMRRRRAELEANMDFVEELLRKNGERAREEAAKTLDKVRTAVGLR
ncbi:MAG: tryptophan--tRNA ligase [Lentisphaerae bacterium]|nr:tryptophan--tRNA ligase [Lentisphaerota bacterium]MBQ9803997.1 tryptophan--tRNA ligase [Lentisphaeria bacterium]